MLVVESIGNFQLYQYVIGYILFNRACLDILWLAIEYSLVSLYIYITIVRAQHFLVSTACWLRYKGLNLGSWPTDNAWPPTSELHQTGTPAKHRKALFVCNTFTNVNSDKTRLKKRDKQENTHTRPCRTYTYTLTPTSLPVPSSRWYVFQFSRHASSHIPAKIQPQKTAKHSASEKSWRGTIESRYAIISPRPTEHLQLSRR